MVVSPENCILERKNCELVLYRKWAKHVSCIISEAVNHFCPVQAQRVLHCCKKSSNNDKKLSIRLNKSHIYIVYNFHNKRIYRVTEFWVHAEQNAWLATQFTCSTDMFVIGFNAQCFRNHLVNRNISINTFINHNLRTTKADQSAV